MSSADKQFVPDKTSGFDTLMVFTKVFFLTKVEFELIQQMLRKHAKLSSRQRVNLFYHITSRLGVK